MLDFKLIQPSDALGELVQGIWAASVSTEAIGPIRSNLYSDGGTGVLFNLGEEITLAGTALARGVTLLPVNKRVEQIELPPGARLAGFRFHPAVGYALFGLHSDSPLHCDGEQAQRLNLLVRQLTPLTTLQAQLRLMRDWLESQLGENPVPLILRQAMREIEQQDSAPTLSISSSAQQRQVQRLFKRWLGVSPKYYQRLNRFKRALAALRDTPEADLAVLALELGFTDQAHMTREFQHLSDFTPAAFAKRKRLS